jgi:hypothetical protein
MISGKELRLGNSFTYGKHEEVETVYQITFDRREGHLVNGIFPEKHCTGIPLSPEVISKLGFRKLNNAWVPNDYNPTDYNKWRFTIWDDDNGDYKYNSAEFDRQLTYVHEVQNIHFWLTGVELIYNPNDIKK